MKITFDDKSFVNCYKDGDKIIIMIEAKDHMNPLKKITNAVELTFEEFKKLISEVAT